MGDMKESFDAMKEMRRQERDNRVDAAQSGLPTSSDDVFFGWVNEFHAQAIFCGKVIAQWWPSRGSTMVGQRKGPRCATASDFVALAVSASKRSP